MAQGGKGGKYDQRSTSALRSTSGKIGGYLYGKASLGTKLNKDQRARREAASSPEAMGSKKPTKKSKFKGASRSRKR